MKNRFTFLFALPVLALACGGSDEAPKAPTTTASSAVPAAPAPPKAETTPATTTAVATPPAPVAPTPVVKYTGFQTPESVLFDEANDRYLVSNINGKPNEVDNNGYIEVLSPDGKVTTEKWIEGGKNKVTLNAPKGSAIVKDVLYVADLDTVRTFDLKTGAPKAQIKIAGASFLNDVAAGPDGKVYVTDTGVDGSFQPNGTDAVYVIEKGAAKPLAKSKDLKQPNGVAVSAAGVLVNTMGGAEVYRLGAKGEKLDVTTLPKGKLDGLVVIGDTLLVSSWEGNAIYKGKLNGTFVEALAPLSAPADIGYDTKRSRVLVPRFSDNTVEVYEIK